MTCLRSYNCCTTLWSHDHLFEHLATGSHLQSIAASRGLMTTFSYGFCHFLAINSHWINCIWTFNRVIHFMTGELLNEHRKNGCKTESGHMVTCLITAITYKLQPKFQAQLWPKTTCIGFVSLSRAAFSQRSVQFHRIQIAPLYRHTHCYYLLTYSMLLQLTLHPNSEVCFSLYLE